jgi:hypothetical protein
VDEENERERKKIRSKIFADFQMAMIAATWRKKNYVTRLLKHPKPSAFLIMFEIVGTEGKSIKSMSSTEELENEC